MQQTLITPNDTNLSFPWCRLQRWHSRYVIRVRPFIGTNIGLTLPWRGNDTAIQRSEWRVLYHVVDWSWLLNMQQWIPDSIGGRIFYLHSSYLICTLLVLFAPFSSYLHPSHLICTHWAIGHIGLHSMIGVRIDFYHFLTGSIFPFSLPVFEALNIADTLHPVWWL